MRELQKQPNQGITSDCPACWKQIPIMLHITAASGRNLAL